MYSRMRAFRWDTWGYLFLVVGLLNACSQEPRPTSVAASRRLAAGPSEVPQRFASTASSPSAASSGPHARLCRATPIEFPPGEVDSNSPVFWRDGVMHMITSRAWPFLSTGTSLEDVLDSPEIARTRFDNHETAIYCPDFYPFIESVWEAPNGDLYAWYHVEHPIPSICPGTSLTAPKIGAAVSRASNGSVGSTWTDLGIVISESTDLRRCDSKNDYFAGGTGDFSVLVQGDHAYFYFGTYGGEAKDQGIAAARMELAHIDHPIGNVWKWTDGSFSSPGIDGSATILFPARRSWHDGEPNSFWGPALHFNTHLEQYVMLLNRSMNNGWNQEGIFVSFGASLDRPESFSEPVWLAPDLGWYAEVIDDRELGTDRVAGERARFFVHGRSKYNVMFSRERTPPRIAAIERRDPIREPVITWDGELVRDEHGEVRTDELWYYVIYGEAFSAEGMRVEMQCGDEAAHPVPIDIHRWFPHRGYVDCAQINLGLRQPIAEDCSLRVSLADQSSNWFPVH